MKTKENNRLILKNRKAYFNYEILNTEIAGISLLGSEVKSVRKTKVSFTDSYCFFIGNELWIRNLYISKYEQTGYLSHDPKRDKKLLMTKKQLSKFKKQFEIEGITIVPLAIQTNDRGVIKVNIGLAKGKKQYDKKEKIKEQDSDRDVKKTLG